MIFDVDDEHFKATISVCANNTFYIWVFGFNGKIKIVGSHKIETSYKEMLQYALDRDEGFYAQ